MLNITSYSYSFEKLINNKFLYVDKTEYIWNLIRLGDAGYFLSRPRRFGKSLTVSTLKAIFEGKKELFKGLAIYDKPYDWKPYPVIHLSFAGMNPAINTPQGLRKYFTSKVNGAAADFSISLTEEEPGMRLGQLIDTLYREKKEQVVILIDEYDKPILNNVTNPQVDALLNELKGFFGVLKERNEQERFIFVTGVSKFCHVSLFSEFNNPTDISTDYDYATMLGYTQEELEKYFAEHIDRACKQLNIPKEELLSEIKAWYNGYRFHAQTDSVYNPVSVARFFTNHYEFNNYWIDTGTPTFLLKLMRQKQFNLERALTSPVTKLAFKAFEIDRIDPKTLMLQTGYLTIKSSFLKLGETMYNLDFPNREVKAAFEIYFISYYTSIPEDVVGANVLDMVEAIKARDINLFMDLLKTFLSAVQYDINVDSEGRFQILFLAIFVLVGVRIEAESRTNNGRIDAVIVDGDTVFIFEFKANKSAKIAFKQIQDKEYFQKYKHSGKKIMLIGVNYDTTARQISKWKTQTIE